MIILLLTLNMQANAETAIVRRIAVANGFAPSKRAMAAISNAALRYDVPVTYLTAIALLESGASERPNLRSNKNGTQDVGMFQINTVNRKFCIKYNLSTPEGSAFCAALLLSRLKRSRPNDWYAAYHSKTPHIKAEYKNKVDFILAQRILTLSSN